MNARRLTLLSALLILAAVIAASAAPQSEALAYLRREAVVLPGGTPRGFVLLTWQGLPLGFAKNVGNRANNLYPPEWRIRMQA